MTPEQFASYNLLPDKENENIIKAIVALGLEGQPIYIDIIPNENAVNGKCFLNVFDKIQKDKGEVVYGWQFLEHAYMIEAEFHAIWKSPNGILVDITPCADPNAKQILFIIDHNKIFEGNRTDNFRLNTTDNELVDDIIELEKAKFRFIDKVEDVNENDEMKFNEEENMIGEILYSFSSEVDEMFKFNGSKLSKCFCNSGLTYERCHRQFLNQFLLTI